MSKYIGSIDSYNDAKAVLFGAPFDGTASFRPGSRFAPEAIRRESWGLETYSPYQDKDLADVLAYDDGDLDLPFGNAQAVLDIVEQKTAQILKNGKTPVMLGGEHLVTLGAFRAVYAKYEDVCVVHFDAHTDLREDYMGERLSHATVIRRIYDAISTEGGTNQTKRVWQFGIRSGEKNEFEFAEKHGHISKFTMDGIDEAVEVLKDKPVYITVDLDVLDPSVFPGTGTPEPGGVTFMELLNALIKLGALNVVGFDIVELAPDYDRSGISTAAACKVLREMLVAFA